MWKWTQRTFNGGVQDGTLGGRQDLQAYYNGAKTIDNFLVKRQGCISKRRGTELVANLDGLFGEGYKLTHARAIPFVYERDGGYTLLFAEGEKHDEGGEVADTKRGIFICSKFGILLRGIESLAPGAAGSMSPSTDDPEERWDTETYFKEQSGNYITEWTPVKVEIPYEGADFNAIGYSQSGDTLFIAHEKYPFATLKRVDGNRFEYSVVDFLAQGASNRYYPPVLTARWSTAQTGSSLRTISYVATYVKNGIESAPSTPVFVSYKTPWSEGLNLALTASKGANEEEPDFYNIYKKSDGEYGFIATTGKSKQDVLPEVRDDFDADTGSYDTGSYTVNQVNNGNGTVSVGQGEFTQDVGVTKTNLINKVFSGGNLVASDSGNGVVNIFVGGVCSASAERPIVVDFKEGVAFSEVELLLGIGSTSSTLKFNYGVYRYYVTSYYFSTMKGNGAVTLSASFEIKVSKPNQSTGAVEVVSKTISAGAVLMDASDFSAHTAVHKQKQYANKEVTKAAVVQSSFDGMYSQKIILNVRDKIEALRAEGTIPDGATWSIAKMEISAKDASGEDVDVKISSAKCFSYDSTSNIANDDYITPDVSLTPPVVEPHFEGSTKYPSTVALQDQRLVLAATNEKPFTLWMSTVGDLYNFNTHDSIREDDAIEATIPATEFPEINHVISAKNLILLCDNGEWIVRPTSGNTISFKTIEIKQQSQIGCSKRLPPLPVADELIFAESTSETLRAMQYDWTSDGYKTQDLSVLSQSLTRNNPIVDYAYKQHPDSIVVCVLKDGSLATLTYMKEHEVCAWSTAHLGDGKLQVVGICTDKALHEGTTDTYLLAKDGDERFQLLRVREDAPEVDVKSSVCLDAIRWVTAGAAAIVADGQVAVDLKTGKVLEAGAQLVEGCEYAVGYPFTATFRSVRPEAQGQNTIQFELKGPANAEVRVLNPSAFKVVPTDLEAEANMWTDAEVVAPEVVDGVMSWPKQSDYLLSLAGDYNTSGALTLKSESVYPLTLLSYSVNFNLDPRLNER